MTSKKSKGGTATCQPGKVKLTQPIKWHSPGGKHYLAPKIIELMPPHVAYCEPYAGGLSVLLAKEPDGVSEIVNDLDGELMNFWQTLKNPMAFVEFQRRLEATPFSEREWDHAGIPVYGDPTEKAVCFFIRCRQSLAGRMKSFAPMSTTRTRRGMNEQCSSWLTAVEGLPAVHDRLKRVAILNRNAIDVIRQHDGPDTLFYCDPPYHHDTRASKDQYGLFEMSAADHAQLLDQLSAIKGKFLLSGYPSDLYDSHAATHGWKVHTFELPNNAAGGKSKRRMTECLWCNF